MVRPIKAGELPLIQEWIDADDDHRAKGMKSSFFAEPDRVSFCITDQLGPVMFVRLDPEFPSVRVHIQFPPTGSNRIGRALALNFQEVREQLQRLGAKKLVFDSVSARLTSFCERLWGFQRVGDTNDWELDLAV